MNLQILASTGAFIGRYNGRNHRLFLSVSDTIASDGFEFMMYDSWYGKTDEIISDFNEKGLKILTYHADKFIGQKIGVGGEENTREAFSFFRKNCDMACRLGAKKVILHLWNGPISDDNIENNLNALGELLNIATLWVVARARKCRMPYGKPYRIYKSLGGQISRLAFHLRHKNGGVPL